MTSELALKRDGTMLGLKVRVVANLGASLQSITAIPPLRMMAMAPGCYQIRHCHVEVVAVFTNTVSTGPYRGAGRPESVLNIARLIDKAARDLGMDRLDIRRKNFIRPEQFPYQTGLNVEYDSGDYEKPLAEALRLSDYDQLIRNRDAARTRGELVGVGVSTFVEPSGGAGFESGTVRVERTGETVTPNPFHPLGVKGVGEAGCNGAPPAVANAVMDALASLGIDHIDMPYTAPKLWEAIQAAQGKSQP
jgi:carbon-monoxide dehydrogenase large subunit